MSSQRGNALVIVGMVVTAIIVLSGAFLALNRLRSAQTTETLTPRAAAKPTAVYTLPTVPASSASGGLKDLVGGGTVLTPSMPQISLGPSGPLTFYIPTLTTVLASDKKAVTLTFDILNNVRSVTYSVTYPTTSGDKGANGSFNVPQPPAATQRIVQLGTCSSGGHCTYDTVTGAISVRAVFTPIFGAATEITTTITY